MEGTGNGEGTGKTRLFVVLGKVELTAGCVVRVIGGGVIRWERGVITSAAVVLVYSKNIKTS
jgi:hypothetical protein